MQVSRHRQLTLPETPEGLANDDLGFYRFPAESYSVRENAEITI